MTDADAPAQTKRSLTRTLAALRRLLLRRLPAEEARDVREHVEAEGRLTERYLLMSALSAGIATLGLLQSSSAVVIGAMLVSPLMSPIARLGFAFSSLDGRRAQDAARVLLIGCGVGMVIGMMITWLSPIRNATPEIVARTAPTLLDLAVAVLSGVAGGYATVHRRGETAIGVAIATALMPPLATVGYSIAVMRWDFAGGALLLFLTNLAAISFSFAAVARIRGVARPLQRVEFSWRYVAIGVGAFLVLATPLALTLARVARETTASAAARQEISRSLNIDASQIAQLTVAWPTAEPPRIAATVIAPQFSERAEETVRARLDARLQSETQFRLQQIVASDSRAQTQAMVEAAITAHQLAPVGPASPQLMDNIAHAARFRIAQSWANAAEQSVILMAAPQTDWSISRYRAEEARLGSLGFGWTVRIVPPYADRLPVLFDDDQAAIAAPQRQAIEDVAWALSRWGVRNVAVEGVSGANTGATRTSRILAETRAATVAAALGSRDFSVTPRLATRAVSTTLAREGATRAVSTTLAREGAPRVRAADVIPFDGQ